MATVTLTLWDTATGSVALHSSFTPAVRYSPTPAQAHALDLIASTKNRWDKPDGAPSTGTSGLLSEHWGDPAP